MDGPRPNNGPERILDLNTSFERSLSELSENLKKFDIGSTVLKLWLLKHVQLHPPPIRLINGSGTLSAAIT